MVAEVGERTIKKNVKTKHFKVYLIIAGILFCWQVFGNIARLIRTKITIFCDIEHNHKVKHRRI